jgi:hypothetical protein
VASVVEDESNSSGADVSDCTACAWESREAAEALSVEAEIVWMSDRSLFRWSASCCFSSAVRWHDDPENEASQAHTASQEEEVDPQVRTSASL